MGPGERCDAMMAVDDGARHVLAPIARARWRVCARELVRGWVRSEYIVHSGRSAWIVRGVVKGNPIQMKFITAQRGRLVHRRREARAQKGCLLACKPAGGVCVCVCVRVHACVRCACVCGA